MTRPQMLLSSQLGHGYGFQPDAWRAPGVDASYCTDFDAPGRYAWAAERGMRCTRPAESLVSSP
jgi:hypothetical protein